MNKHCWHLEPIGPPSYICCFCGRLGKPTNTTPPDGHGEYKPGRKRSYDLPADGECPKAREAQ